MSVPEAFDEDHRIEAEGEEDFSREVVELRAAIALVNKLSATLPTQDGLRGGSGGPPSDSLPAGTSNGDNPAQFSALIDRALLQALIGSVQIPPSDLAAHRRYKSGDGPRPRASRAIILTFSADRLRVTAERDEGTVQNSAPLRWVGAPPLEPLSRAIDLWQLEELFAERIGGLSKIEARARKRYAAKGPVKLTLHQSRRLLGVFERGLSLELPARIVSSPDAIEIDEQASTRRPQGLARLISQVLVEASTHSARNKLRPAMENVTIEGGSARGGTTGALAHVRCDGLGEFALSLPRASIAFARAILKGLSDFRMQTLDDALLVEDGRFIARVHTAEPFQPIDQVLDRFETAELSFQIDLAELLQAVACVSLIEPREHPQRPLLYEFWHPAVDGVSVLLLRARPAGGLPAHMLVRVLSSAVSESKGAANQDVATSVAPPCRARTLDVPPGLLKTLIEGLEDAPNALPLVAVRARHLTHALAQAKPGEIGTLLVTDALLGIRMERDGRTVTHLLSRAA